MKTLALDISSTACGWAVGKVGERPEASGAIIPLKRTPFEKRMVYICEGVLDLIEEHKVEDVLIEELAFGNNKNTTMGTVRMIAGTVGAVQCWIMATHSIECRFLVASHVRKNLGVDQSRPEPGTKRKDEMKLRTRDKLLELGYTVTTLDESDAVTWLWGGK